MSHIYQSFPLWKIVQLLITISSHLHTMTVSMEARLTFHISLTSYILGSLDRYNSNSASNMRLLSFLLLLHAIFLCSSSLLSTVSSATLGNETDRLALLSFKSQITQDPFNVLSSWNNSRHFCDWDGVICSRRHYQRVQSILLYSYDLSGQIPPHVGNLSFLRKLNLGNNSFHGIISGEISQLFRLRYLYLHNNSFVGEIPNNISSCSNLIELDISHNNLVGNLPIELGYLSKLDLLGLRRNNLSGVIPPSFGNLTFLKVLDISENSFSGSIPSSLSQLKSLVFLDFTINNLSGMFPSPLYNISTLEVISISINNLEGKLPSDIGLSLSNLQILNLNSNKFSGPIPTCFYNASKLQQINLVQNQFTGQIHHSVGNLNGLQSLFLGFNNFGRGKSGDLDFITSLINCSSLQVLDISSNQFGGMLPISVANLTKQLTMLTLGTNLISGNIPNSIGNLQNLIYFSLYGNRLTGSIPMGIGKLQNLQVLDLGENQLLGHIPASIKNCSHLYFLNLGENNLGGTINSCLDNQNLQQFYVASNSFTGPIPPDIGLCSGLLHFLAGSNLFTGSIPSVLGHLKNILSLDLSENKLSGEIPSSLGSCLNLEYINIGSNFLSGSIPSSFGSLKNLQDLDLSCNDLSGEIPKVLGEISLLQTLNLSSNNLEGEVPTEGIFKNASAISISRNRMICGGIPQLGLPKCRGLKSTTEKNGIAWKMVMGVVIPSFMVVLIFLICWRKKHAQKSYLKRLPGDLRRISYKDLHNATNGFSPTNLLGIGNYGSVYKGTFHQDESHVAVKVLNLLERGAFKSFIAECETLKAVRHRNLLKIITVCSSVDFNGFDFKALVFEFMPNGSLEDWLHPVSDELKTVTSLDISQRLSIAIDVASALDYLHNLCGTPIIHCDLKPGNILLNGDFSACVGDFGLAKYYLEVTSTTESHQNATNSCAIRGTIGYIPPEYGTGGKVSPEGDVYSYGILLLEIFTGKRPTDHIFQDGLTLPEFSRRALAEEVMEVIDTRLLSEISINELTTVSFNQTKDCLTSIINIGIKCSLEQMSERMGLRDVLNEMNSIKEALVRL